jgi:hypothetical protein
MFNYHNNSYSNNHDRARTFNGIADEDTNRKGHRVADRTPYCQTNHGVDDQASTSADKCSYDAPLSPPYVAHLYANLRIERPHWCPHGRADIISHDCTNFITVVRTNGLAIDGSHTLSNSSAIDGSHM